VIAFNVAHLESFKKMVEIIGRYGSSLKPPNYQSGDPIG